jgi:hypothetical protein
VDAPPRSALKARAREKFPRIGSTLFADRETLNNTILKGLE